jgi:hypothetical protein
MDGHSSSSTRIPNSHFTSSFYSIDFSTVPSTPTLSCGTSQSMRSSLMSSPISPCWLPERTMRYPERPKDEKPVERLLFPSSEVYDCMVSDLAVAPIVPFAIHNSVNHEHGMKDHEGSMQSLDPRFMAHKVSVCREWKRQSNLLRILLDDPPRLSTDIPSFCLSP